MGPPDRRPGTSKPADGFSNDVEFSNSLAGVPPLPSPEADSFDVDQQRQRLLTEMFGFDEQTRIGQYELLGEIGRGAMGVVYVAFDHHLARKVAIKRVQKPGNPEHHRRLVDEAKAMAQLSHPNVVPVFETREQDGMTFIVMEYVEGVTLSEWLRQEPREMEDILDAFMAAGAGLAAAHSRGLVHRDFKPANVILGNDGRIRVMDFGLACPDPSEDSTLDLKSAASQPDSGGIAGTPPYMAPEQFRGRWTDARSDQFSFCVALYEALYGERPFTGTRKQIWAAAERGEIRPEPRGTTVPKWLRQAIVRGLQPDPRHRYASMQALLDALNENHEDAIELRSRSEPSPGGPRRRAGGYGAFIGLLAMCAVTTLAVQPHVCPVVVDIEACHIQVEGDDEISRAWMTIGLSHGGEYEIAVDGKILHFDCVDPSEVVTVIVDLKEGGLRYWSPFTPSGDDTLRLSDAKPGLPDGLSPAFRRELDQIAATGGSRASQPPAAPTPEGPPQQEQVIAHEPELSDMAERTTAEIPWSPVRRSADRPPPGTAAESEHASQVADAAQRTGATSTDRPAPSPTEAPIPQTLTEQIIIDTLKDDLINCGKEHPEAPSLFADIQVKLQIDPDGQVVNANVVGEAKGSAVAGCVGPRIENTYFPRSVDGASRTVSLPLR